MKQATEPTAFRSIAQRLADEAPESSSGWIVEADGRTVRVAGITDEPECVHATREQLVETIAWGLFVEAEESRRAELKSRNGASR